MNYRIVRRATLFGKSYMWLRVAGRLELHPDFTQRWLFSNGERRQMERWRTSGTGLTLLHRA